MWNVENDHKFIKLSINLLLLLKIEEERERSIEDRLWNWKETCVE